MKVVSARKLWTEILNSQIETGTPYMLFKVFQKYKFILSFFGPFLLIFVLLTGYLQSEK